MDSLTETSRKPSHPIRILGIAPYEGMKNIMQRLARERDDIEVDVFVGDLQEGLTIARQNVNQDYDAIISRGGTAQLLKEETRIPVIEATLSVYDILRAIKLAENYSDRYAIVGFPAITANAHILCDLLLYNIDIFTIHDESEAIDVLKDLRQKGYKMVLCDMISSTTAKRMGLNAILITSGQESISNAFDQAVKLCSSYSQIKAENHFYEEILHGGNDQTVVLGEDGDVFFSTIQGEQLNTVLKILRHELSAVLSKKTLKFFKNIDGTLYSFICKSMDFLGTRYAAFYFSSSSVPFATSKYGIQYSNQQEAEDHFFNSFYSIISVENNMQLTIENLNQTSFPVMLAGESGSGKEQAARLLYSRSALSANPLVTVNCSLLNDRSWNFLTNHYNSPFNDNNNTIFLKDITALPTARRTQLLSIIIDTNLCKRNRVLFSCVCPMGKGIPPEAMEFVNQLSCLTLHLPPLRERPDEIPTLASLYLNTINISASNQIIGLEPEALKLLQGYSWPHNYAQFKRILNELSLVTTTPYIQAENVAALLSKEGSPLTKAGFPTGSDSASAEGQHLLDLSRPLAEITQDIVRIVLEETGGNQSAAAKRLGISRSTLWRYLK